MTLLFRRPGINLLFYRLFLAKLDDGNPLSPTIVGAGAVRLHQGMLFKLPPHCFPQCTRPFAVDNTYLAETGNIGIMQKLVEFGQGFIYGQVAEA